MACLGLLAYLVYREREMLSVYLLNADKMNLATVALWYAIGVAVYMATWASIMEQLGGHARLLRHVVVFLIANMAKRLPGTLWYVGGRTVLYSRVGVPTRTVILSSAIEGTLTWLAGVTVAVPFLAVALPEQRWLWVGGGTTTLLLLLNPKSVRWFLDRAAKGGDLQRVALRHVYLWLALYVTCWLMSGAMFASVVSIFQPVPASRLTWIVGSWTVAGSASMLATFLPSNMGITEITLTGLLSQIVPSGFAALVAVSARVLTTLLDMLAGGLAFLIQRIVKG
ncbi:MAG: hypothetical protein ACYC3S_01860 [Chloroflexota bacterium]